MKERQRWQPEEDALLRAYVKHYGPKEWNLISHRMGTSLHRDPKSCLERWKNYLKPGIKKGSLTPEEQARLISLQAKYGNKWKKIAAELPGRTAKRLGKWWEVFKEKQLKANYVDDGSPDQGKYDHILETFAEKYVQPKLFPFIPEPPGNHVLPSWMNLNLCSTATTSSSMTSSSSSSSSSSSATQSPSDPVAILIQHCKEVEERRESLMRHRKEAMWRLSRLEQQLESEKARRRKEKTEEVESEIRRLREEGAAFVSRLEGEYREQVKAVQREDEAEEARLMESWCSNHVRLRKLLEQIGGHTGVQPWQSAAATGLLLPPSLVNQT